MKRLILLTATALATLAGSAALETARWQAEIDAAAAAGGGRVTVPAGIHEVGSLFLKSGVTLELAKGAVLSGSTNIADYADVRFQYAEIPEPWQGVVCAVGQTNVAVVGEGQLSGNGDKFPLGARLGRPRGMIFYRCANAKVEGIRFYDTASWTCYFKECDGVVFRKVSVDCHGNYNSDGVDIDARNVLIEDCEIDSGDDAIVLKSDNPDFIVENVEVRNCMLRTECNLYKLGTGSHGGFRNINIHDCRSGRPRRTTRPDSGDDIFHRWRLETYPGAPKEAAPLDGIVVDCVDGGLVENVTFRNIDLGTVHVPIFIRGGQRLERWYGEKEVRLQIPFGRHSTLRNVTIENVTAQQCSYTASSLTGVPGLRLENIVLRNVKITVPGARDDGLGEVGASVPEKANDYPQSNMFDARMLPAYGFYIRHADKVTFDHVKVNVKIRDPRPQVALDDVTGFTRDGEKLLKVLMIGNSFSVCNLREMPSFAAAAGKRLRLVSMQIGGCPLEKHWKLLQNPDDPSFGDKNRYHLSWNSEGVVNGKDDPLAKLGKSPSLESVLKAEKWDVVTIQQASPLSNAPASYEPFAGDLVARIRELSPSAEIVVQETWGYAPEHAFLKGKGLTREMHHAQIRAAYASLAKKYGLRVIPTGDAAALFQRRYPVDDTKAPEARGDVIGADLKHFGPRGYYLQAATWTGVLFKMDPKQVLYRPVEISDADARLMRECASEAISRWDFEDDPTRYWNLGELSKVPAYRELKGTESDWPGLKALMVSGKGPKDSAAEFFCYYGVPSTPRPAGGFPAVVLVHGGGGTAYPNYVEDWTKLGFAVIAPDWNNTRPAPALTNVPPTEVSVPRLPLPGGKRSDHVANVANMVLAHSLVRSFPEVNPDRTVFVGLSWGSWFGVCVASVDSRFKGCVEIYCGDKKLRAVPASRDWLVNGRFLHAAKIPMYWSVSTNDGNVTPESSQEGFDACANFAGCTIVNRLPHSHCGFNFQSVRRMAAYFVGMGPRMPRLVDATVADGVARARIADPGTGIVRAKLGYTLSDAPNCMNRLWKYAPAEIKDGVVTAKIPDGTKMCYLAAFEQTVPHDSRYGDNCGTTGFLTVR